MNQERKRAIERLLAAERINRIGPLHTDANADAATPEEYAKAQQLWAELGSLRRDPDYSALLGRPTWRERLAVACELAASAVRGLSTGRMAGAAGLAAVVLLVTLALEPGRRAESFATQHAEVRDLSFDDGTHIALGPMSKLQVAYGDDSREVSMDEGEAYFEVRRDKQRPFIITAGDTRIAVVGTAFNVKYTAYGVQVSVAEGLVRVTPHDGSLLRRSDALAIPAGTELFVSPSRQAFVRPIDISTPGGWRSGQLDYSDAALADIIMDLNRYLPGGVSLDDSAAIASRRLTTSFRTDRSMQFLHSLPSILPVSVSTGPDGGLVITERH